jgi:glycosyltransferase involved in cell wall biosynthesis
MKGGSLSIVVSTYEWPEALDAVLRGLAGQSDRSFDVVVADDGSGSETEETVDRWRPVFGNRLAHAWQPDEGFRLAGVRNLGASSARGSYLVFIDGDCIPRRHFVAAIRRVCSSARGSRTQYCETACRSGVGALSGSRLGLDARYGAGDISRRATAGARGDRTSRISRPTGTRMDSVPHLRAQTSKL